MKKVMKRIIVIVSALLVFLIGLFSLVWQSELESNFLDEEFLELQKYFEMKDQLNPEISMAPVSWHLDHILLVNNRIYEQMKSSDIQEYDAEFNFTRSLVFITNSIPRGRGQAPASVQPKDHVNLDTILKHLKEAKLNIDKINELDKNAFFEHPVFGRLNRKHTKRFLKIHTQHHLDIIKDILQE